MYLISHIKAITNDEDLTKIPVVSDLKTMRVDKDYSIVLCVDA